MKSSRKWFSAILAGLLSALALWCFGTQLERNYVRADPNGIKYTGAGQCASCHSEQDSAAKADGIRMDNYLRWKGADLHSKAYTGKDDQGRNRGLTSDLSKQIAASLQLPEGDATKSARCLSCHALSGMKSNLGLHRTFLKPEEIVQDKYEIRDGVSCDACHGPAEKYLKAHAEKGWTQRQRETLGSQKLFDEWGLYDTKNLKFRANNCVSCHLQIDHDLIEHGHPDLPFELSLYSQQENWVHWREKEKWFRSKAWAIGQAVSLREAALQMKKRIEIKAQAGLVQDAYRILISHALPVRQIAEALAAAERTKLDEVLKQLPAASADAVQLAQQLQGLAQWSEGFADWIAGQPSFDEAITRKLLVGLATEGEALGNSGFKGARQYFWGMLALWSAIKFELNPPDADAKFGPIVALSRPLGKSESAYTAAEFIAGAKKLTEVFAGGKALPVPDGLSLRMLQPPAPVVAVKSEEPQAAAQPQVQGGGVPSKPKAEVGALETPDERKQPLAETDYGKFVFCINCGYKFEGTQTGPCRNCGTTLPPADATHRDYAREQDYSAK